MSAPVLELSDVAKDYRRPAARFAIAAAARCAPAIRSRIVGLDQPAAEVFVNLVTGATLPDAGEVQRVRPPHQRRSPTARTGWPLVDRFGIVSERAVLLDALSVVQNLAMPFTLEIEPPPDDIRERAVALAREVGLPEAAWTQPVAQLDGAGRLRVGWRERWRSIRRWCCSSIRQRRLLPARSRGLALRFARLLRRRGAAAVALTADRDFAGAVATRVLTLEAATGRLSARGGWWSRLLGPAASFESLRRRLAARRSRPIAAHRW